MLLTYIFIILLFIIVSVVLYKVLKLYFNYREKGQAHKHYPIILGITLLSIPIISNMFSIPSYLIKFFNHYTFVNLPMPQDDWKSIVFYALYIFSVIVLSYIYYKLYPNKKENFKDKNNSFNINYPDNENIIISPLLYERIKELFELKYEKQNLKLFYDEKEKLLVGHYSDAIHSYRYFIYCNQNLNDVSASMQDEVFERLTLLSKDLDEQDMTYYESKYFFFIENGTFEKSTNKHFKCYTEDEFLNVVVDFNSYLRKNIERFDSQLTDIGGISLHDSFIEPSFNGGKQDLKFYFDDWLKEKSLRHISLLSHYGMGKTSFLKYYTKYLSQKILEGEAFTRYPVFISLTNTSPMSNDGIETKIKGFVSEELAVNYALFEHLVHLGKIVFILDGFDEMGFIGTAKTRFDQFNSIWKLATKDNKILISGRKSYLPTDFERKNVLNIVDKELYDAQKLPFTEVIELDYFELKQIKKTLNIYYTDSEKVAQYLNYIEKNHSILDLCKRPSMLHMTMSILPTLYVEGSNKVITSSDIMNKYTEYWISRQESKEIRGYFSSNDAKKKEFIINFFTKLSAEMFKDHTLVVSKEKLDEIILQEIRKSHVDIESNEAVLEGFKNEIYSGYFIEVDINYSKEGYFKFVHKSIFEFFVSKSVIKLIESKKFNDTLLVMDWNREIIDFIDDSIDYDKYKNSKYPSLIVLKDNWIDKMFVIPITNISLKSTMYGVLFIYIITILLASSRQGETLEISRFLQGILIGIITIFLIKVFRRRLNFIKKSYFLEFKKTSIEEYKLQHFLDFYTLFNVNKNVLLQGLKYNNLYIRNLQFIHTQLEDIDFSNSKIKYLYFKNCTLKNVNIGRSFFKTRKFYERIFIISIDVLYYGLFFIAQSMISLNIVTRVRYKIKKTLVKLYRSKIVLTNMTPENFDATSIKSFQEFIKNNKLERRDIICDSKLKDVLFSKFEQCNT